MPVHTSHLANAKNDAKCGWMKPVWHSMQTCCKLVSVDKEKNGPTKQGQFCGSETLQKLASVTQFT